MVVPYVLYGSIITFIPAAVFHFLIPPFDFNEGTFFDDDLENSPYKVPTILLTNAPTIDQNAGPDGIKIYMVP